MPFYPDDFLELFRRISYSEPNRINLYVSKYFSHIKGHNNMTFKPEPLIVPPTWNKNSYHGTISQVWERASEKLSKAKNIIIIGYSLPDSDLFFKYLYALGTLGSSRIRNVYVINPDIKNGDTDRRFQSLIGESIGSRYNYKESYFIKCLPFLENYLSLCI